MNGYEDTECEKYFTPPDKPSTAREAVLTLLKSPPIKLRNKENPVGEVNLEKLADQILSLIEPKVLSNGQHLIQVSVTRKEMLAMPKEVRHQILERQSVEFNISHPEYYKTDDELDEQAMKDIKMMD